MKTTIRFALFILLLVMVVAYQRTTATTTEPLRYVAILSQHGPNAPTANVLYNTLGGTPTWTRIGAGYYRANLSGAFPAERTTVIVPTHQDSLDDYTGGARGDGDSVYVFGFTPAGNLSDDVWHERHVEITVYPTP